MPLSFRNVITEPSAPVADWPTEAVQAALERGDLGDWQRLAAAIRDDPWGPTARQVEEILAHTRPYGVAELMETAIACARGRAEQEERRTVAAEIRGAVERSRLTRAAFASRIGTSASRLSTYVNGTVTPPAALMVRIRRLVDRIGG